VDVILALASFIAVCTAWAIIGRRRTTPVTIVSEERAA
jgi:hypothetical protein